ncbi:FAD/NAD(P)-binding protein [Aeromicrobium sp. 179-A 4D2 NHS]|uniref:FAD/NAD(P)-binding protein n=1 Tax=Aeromicrobium sp. 179-A 4D2 NHS TaxID=3142375 RepID=UPI0039A3094A
MTDTRALRPTVLVVGGGAAGALTALHLAREATSEVEVVVIDPAVRLAAGTAFSTTDPDHLLNVPASGMSALPDEPGHFAQWRSRTTGAEVDPHEFAPRREWGRYLAETLDASVRGSRVTLRHVRATATSVDRAGTGVLVGLDDGRRLAGDALVVGTGLPAPSPSWAPEAMRASDRFVVDPWAPGALARVDEDPGRLPDVLVVGTGLTMVDVVTTLARRPDRFLHAVSRSGRLPRRHADGPQAPVVPDVTQWGHDLASIADHTHAHLREAEIATGDWRPGLDGLRHRVQDLWGRLDERDRLAFLARYAAAWNRIRHRVPGPSAQRIDGLTAAGRLTTSAARVTGAEAVADGLRVTLEDGTVREVGWVVNCTGPDLDVRDLGDPLVDGLLESGLATCATAGMGFRTRDGRLLDATGTVGAPVWVLGALRRGELWESTAVPEIRVQAAAAATAVLTTIAPSPTLTEGIPR